MPTECSLDLFGFAPVAGREVVAAFDGGAITSDAGALLLGATDHAIRMTARNFRPSATRSRFPTPVRSQPLSLLKSLQG
jgi:hypothetical protein